MTLRSYAKVFLAVILCFLTSLIGCSAPRPGLPSYQPREMEAALNALRSDINARYGFRNGAPRINLGPCGRFARDFREHWNARFRQPVTIAFLMSNTDASNCYHVLVKLPDGRFFDGGNGVTTQEFLMTLYSNMHVEEMKDFDFELLDRRSYGLGRTYPECPNYSDEFTRQVIESRLFELLQKAK